MSNLDQFFLKSRRQNGVTMTTRRQNKNTLRFTMSKTVEATTPDEMEEALNLPNTRALIEDFLSNDPTTVNGNPRAIDAILFQCVGGTNDGEQFALSVPPSFSTLERFFDFLNRCRAGGGNIRVGGGGNMPRSAGVQAAGPGRIGLIFHCEGGTMDGEQVSVVFPPEGNELERFLLFQQQCRDGGGRIAFGPVGQRV